VSSDDPFGPAPGDGPPDALAGPAADVERRRPVPESVVRTADRWRVVGIALALLWVVLLMVVVGLWVRVTWYPQPDDEIRGYVPLLLAPAAVVSVLLAGWALGSAWRLYRRRRSGWDAPLVLGALAVAVSGYSLVPSTTVVPEMLWLGVVGLGSAVAATLGERAWRRL
jgi:cation transport ATPase